MDFHLIWALVPCNNYSGIACKQLLVLILLHGRSVPGSVTVDSACGRLLASERPLALISMRIPTGSGQGVVVGKGSALSDVGKGGGGRRNRSITAENVRSITYDDSSSAKYDLAWDDDVGSRGVSGWENNGVNRGVCGESGIGRRRSSWVSLFAFLRASL